MTKEEKVKKKWYKRWWAILLFLFLFLVFFGVLFGEEPSPSQQSIPSQVQNQALPEEKQPTKNQAYYKCLSKSKECSDNIPAIQLEFLKACKDIYLYTSDAKELIDFTDGMC